jgi:two-component system, NtrC family, sensor histidine kinase HydH
MSDRNVTEADPTIETRSAEIRNEHLHARWVRVDRMFCVLFVVQYLAGIIGAVTVSPYAWEGKVHTVHLHVWMAVVGGAGIIVLPILLAVFRPGTTLTRHVIAASQMLSSALLIHLTGGRIETHFHVFGSLAFLAFYLDWQVLITATVVVAADHFLRGIYWPESVYGVANPEWWRFLEHAAWVAFEDVFLIWSCVVGQREIASSAARQSQVEHLSELSQLKSAALEMAMAEMQPTSA